MSGVRVEGLNEAITDLNKEIKKIENLAQDGLWEAGLKVMASAQKRLRPSVISGNLRASGYVRSNSQVERPMPEKLGGNNEAIPSNSLPAIGVELGFTAVYALNVHENMEGRAPKFLENALTENKDAIIAIVKKRSGADA